MAAAGLQDFETLLPKEVHMIRNIGEFISSVEQGARMGVGPGSRVLARKGNFGAEHVIEHVKVRQNTITGQMEMIVQIADRPNDG